MRKFTILCGILCLVSCKDDPAVIDNLDGSMIADLASRGDIGVPDRSSDQALASSIQFGAIADIHPDGEYQLLTDLVAALDTAGVDFFVVLGDIALNGALRGIEEKTEDRLEIIRSLEIIAGPGLPVYVLAGNHDTRTSYGQAMEDLLPRLPNIVDLTPVKVIERQGLVLAALSGSHNPGVVPSVDGFLYGRAEVDLIAEELAQREGPVVLLTHDPPRTAGPEGIDYVDGAGNVGDPALSTLIGLHQINFSLSGHIHFSSPRAVDGQNSPVGGGTWSDQLYLNVGAADRGAASLVSYEEGQMMYRMVNVH